MTITDISKELEERMLKRAMDSIDHRPFFKELSKKFKYFCGCGRANDWLEDGSWGCKHCHYKLKVVK